MMVVLPETSADQEEENPAHPLASIASAELFSTKKKKQLLF